ncbi:MAG: ankyrin repeat domain-containing protein [Actinomycetota bacterium]
MPVRNLPSDPSPENLRNQARTLQRRVRAGDPEALAAVRAFHPHPGSRSGPAADPAGGGETWQATFSLADAQLVTARQYGFPSWPRLRRHLDVVAAYSRSPGGDGPGGGSGSAPGDGGDPGRAGGAGAEPAQLADEFLRLACLRYDRDDPARWAQAAQLLAAYPEIALASIHTMTAAGEAGAVAAALAADPGLVHAEGGPMRWAPLLYAAYSRVECAAARSTLEVARLLLAAGADPDAGYLWHGLPSPFTALTGAFGRGEGDPPPHPQATELATLLLDAGADPNDSQALYNCGLADDAADDGYLRLLLRYGLGTGTGGPWHARMGFTHPSPTELLDDELVKAAARGLAGRARLLLDHGADPRGLGTAHPLFGGHSALELAALHGHSTVLAMLTEASAAAGDPAGPPDPVLAFLGACMSGAAGTVAELLAADPGLAAAAVAREPDLIVSAAEQDRLDSVRLLAGAGFDVNVLRRAGSRNRALHEAAWNGSMPMIRLLLDLGADPTLTDLSYSSAPSGWAETSGKLEAAAYLAAREQAT